MRINLWTLCCTIFFAYGSIISWFRVAPVYMQEELGAGEMEVGLAFMLMSMAFRGLHVVGGWLADLIGRKRVLVSGTLLMAPFYWLAGEAEHWTTFMGALVACWTIGSMQWPSFLAIISESVEPARRGRALSWLEFCAIGGAVVGPGVGAYLLGPAGLEVRHLLYGTAVLYVIVGLIRLALLRETRPTVDEPGEVRVPVSGILVGLAVGVLGMIAYYLAFDGPFPAKYLHDVFELDYSGINLNMAAGGLVAMLSVFVAGRLIDRIGSVRVILLGFLMFVVMAVLFFQKRWMDPQSLGGGYVWVILVLVPVEFFYLAYEKLSTTIGPARRRGLFVGLFGSTAGLSAAPFLFLGGWLYGIYGFDGPMTVAAVAGVVGVLCTGLLLLILARAGGTARSL